MDMKWMEDFLCLAETRSFSRSASERHASQPAFSRRIQSLESWLGATLVNRASTPLSLTTAGHLFRGHAIGIVQQVHEARNSLRHAPDSPGRTT
jgi:DNA-binding transcriptional LysR family regulator